MECEISQLTNTRNGIMVILHSVKCYNTIAGKTFKMYRTRYEKPLLIWGQKRWKRIPHLKQWQETLGKRYPWTVPCVIKRKRKPKSPARLTDVE